MKLKNILKYISKIKLRHILPIIGIGLFIYILARIGVKNLFSSILKADIRLLLISIVFLIPLYLLQAYKWNYLLDKQKIRLSFKTVMQIHLMGQFYGFLTPARIGSLVKINYLQEKTKQSFSKSSSSVVVDRMLDFISLILLATLGSLFIIGFFTNLYLVLLVILIAMVLLFLIFIDEKRSRFVLKFIWRYFIPDKLKYKARNSFHEFYDNLPSLKEIAYPFFLSLLSSIILYSRGFFVALAFSMNIPYLYYIILVPIATILSLIPITISGFGIRELSLITLFGIFGIDPVTVVSYSLVAYTLANLPVILGLILVVKKSLKKNNN